VAVRAEGCTIWDADGRAYLDAAGGAIVVNVGHGRQSIVDAMERQARAFTYVHGTTFTTEPLETYARAVGRYLPSSIRPSIGQRRLRGDRELPEACAVVPPRSPRAGPDCGLRPLGELPRQLDRCPGPFRSRAAAQAL